MTEKATLEILEKVATIAKATSEIPEKVAMIAKATIRAMAGGAIPQMVAAVVLTNNLLNA